MIHLDIMEQLEIGICTENMLLNVTKNYIV